MTYFRLIKPNWAKPKFKKEVDGKTEYLPNPDFKKEISGPDVLGDEAFDEDYVRGKNEEGYNVYFFPNHPSNPPKGRPFAGKDIDVFNCVFLDMDLKDGVYKSKEEFFCILAEFPLIPTITMDSGNGIHAYWYMSDLTLETFVNINLRLIQKFKTDHSIFTALQLMRYPGSINTKSFDNFKQTEIPVDLSCDQIYTVDRINDVLPEITDDNQKRLSRHINALRGIVDTSMFEGVAPDELPEKFIKEMKFNKEVSNVFNDPINTCGDRSKADMKLANMLWSLDYDRDEALQVMLNTQKSRSRDDRMTYAHNTLDKVYTDRARFTVPNAADYLKSQEGKEPAGRAVNGPEFWDCLKNPWRTTQVLGMIGGSGTGKTSTTLQVFKSLVERNPTSTDIYVFFSLEMPINEIIERWSDLTSGRPEFMNRLYVISNEDADGKARHIGLQEVYWYSRDLQKSTGKKIGAIAIDHLSIMSRHINTQKQPIFNAFGGGVESVRGDNVVLSREMMVSKFKEIAKALDIFVILQSQTTKDKDGGGDLPLGKNAAYGISQFEWYCDYILTFWRPIKRVQDRTNLLAMAWQYAKIRHQHKEDSVKETTHYILGFNQIDGSFYKFSDAESEMIKQLIVEANGLRKAEENKQTVNYQNTPVGKAITKLYAVKDTKK